MILKGLPLAYNKDLQETQEPVFAAASAAERMIRLLARFTSALNFNLERMRAACEQGYLNAMAAATYLVHKGVPFRTAHEKIGRSGALWPRKGLGVERAVARGAKAIRAGVRSGLLLEHHARGHRELP